MQCSFRYCLDNKEAMRFITDDNKTPTEARDALLSEIFEGVTNPQFASIKEIWPGFMKLIEREAIHIPLNAMWSGAKAELSQHEPDKHPSPSSTQMAQLTSALHCEGYDRAKEIRAYRAWPGNAEAELEAIQKQDEEEEEDE